MYYEKPVVMDHYASQIEDFLTNYSIIPVLGTVPAVFKIAFGTIQTLCAATTLVASTFFLMTQTGQDLWYNSFRHVLHGLSNILAGIIQAIPLIGSIVILDQKLRGAHFSDVAEYYANKQSHKFFAYKSIQDTSWVKTDCMSDINQVCLPGDIPTDKPGLISAAPYSF